MIKDLLYYLSIAIIWFATCFAILCIPSFILDSKLSTLWQGIALSVVFAVIYIIKPILKKKNTRC